MKLNDTDPLGDKAMLAIFAAFELALAGLVFQLQRVHFMLEFPPSTSSRVVKCIPVSAVSR